MAHMLKCVVCGYEMASDADCCPHCGSKEKPKRPHCNFCNDERKVYFIQYRARFRSRRTFLGFEVGFTNWSEWEIGNWTSPLSKKNKDGGSNPHNEKGGFQEYEVNQIREEICQTCSRFYERK